VSYIFFGLLLLNYDCVLHLLDYISYASESVSDSRCNDAEMLVAYPSLLLQLIVSHLKKKLYFII
jgi:hypothetical protein